MKKTGVRAGSNRGAPKKKYLACLCYTNAAGHPATYHAGQEIGGENYLVKEKKNTATQNSLSRA